MQIEREHCYLEQANASHAVPKRLGYVGKKLEERVEVKKG